jgi:two-component system, NarL family, sensor histidine kinase EvgS
MDRGLVGGGARLLRGAVPAKAMRAARSRPRVVLVDDLGYVRQALAELLGGAGYDVVAVASGPAALDALARDGADLLLTDLYMPDMSGWELVRAVRERNVVNGRGLPLCIGLYSAVLSGFTREQLARAQVDFAVTKLSDPDAVLDAIERNLAWSEA